MKKYFKVFFILSIWFFILPTAHAQIEVEVGQGQVRVIDLEWPLSESYKSKIEAELMVSEDLKYLVNLPEVRVYAVGDGVMNAADEWIEKTFPEIEKKMAMQIKRLNEANDFYKKEGRAGVQWSSDDDHKKMVVMGSHKVLKENEFVEELVVIGGKVEVFGQVESLVVIGGYVDLKATAVVSKELVVIGGYINKESGATIQGKQVDLSMPGGDEAWGILSDKLKKSFLAELRDNFWIQIFGYVVKVLVLCAFLFLGEFMAPSYQREVQQYLKNYWGQAIIWGFISAFLVLPVTLFLTLSLIGIPLLPLQFSLLFLFVIYGEIHMARLLTSGVTVINSQVGTLVGLVIIEALRFVPYVGTLKWLIILVGFGAASKVFYTRAFRRG